MHHLWFTNEDYATKGNLIKWNPAVKSGHDRDEILKAVIDNRIDVIATDHAPHTLAEKMKPYIEAPSGGPLVQHALIAMLDLHKQGFLDFDHLHTLVLDEADQMLDMGFINDVKKIVKLTPKNRQTLLFSATMPIAIRELAEMFLQDPEKVEVSPVSSTAENVEQRIYFVDKTEKRNLLYHLIKNEDLSNVLVFSRTKHGADNVVKALRKKDIPAEAIHGDKSQNARQRVLDAFKNKEVGVLVATDIAARGIDIEQLPYVINFDLPNIPETYVHRIGRTGRANEKGTAISILTDDELQHFRVIQKKMGRKVTLQRTEGIDLHGY